MHMVNFRRSAYTFLSRLGLRLSVPFMMNILWKIGVSTLVRIFRKNRLQHLWHSSFTTANELEKSFAPVFCEQKNTKLQSMKTASKWL